MSRSIWALLFAMALCLRGDIAVADGDHAEHDAPAPQTKSESELLTEALAQGEVIEIEGDVDSEVSTATTREVHAYDIALTPARSADDVMRLVPGLHISQHASEGKAQQFFLRGFDAVHGADLEVRVAGIPINEMSNVHGHGYVDLGFVVPEVITSLHAHKGSFKLSQGLFGTAGTVEIDLGVAARMRGHRLLYEAGTTNRHRLLALSAPEGQPEATFVSFEAMSDDGFGQNRAASRLGALGQHQLVLGSGDTTLDVLGAAYAARFGEPGTLPLDAVQAGVFDFYDATDMSTGGASRRALVGLRLRHERGAQTFDARVFGGWRHLSLSENFTGYLVNPEMGDTRGQTHESIMGGVRTRYERELTPAISIVAGADGVADSLAQTEDQLTETGEPWQRNRDVDALQLAGDLYLGARFEIGSRFSTELGARYDALHVRAEDAVLGLGRQSDSMGQLSPRIASSYRLGSDWTVFGAYGRGLRPPEARAIAAGGDTMDESGNPGRITTSDAVEIGTRGRLGDHVSVGGGLFGIWIGNEMVFDHISGANLARNATRRVGAEVDVEVEPLPWLSLRGDITAVDARFTGSGEPVPSAPRILSTLEARARHAWGISAGSQLLYIAPRPLAHGATGGTVAVMNLLASYRVGRFDIGMQIDNLWNANSREGEFHFASRFDPAQPASQIPKLHYSAGRPFGVRASVTTWF